MAKPHKIKRYNRRAIQSGQNRKKPLMFLLSAVALCGLIYLGFVLFTPFMNFLTELDRERPVSRPDPEPAVSAEEDPENNLEAEPEPDEAVLSAGDLRAVYLPISIAEDIVALGGFLDSLAGTDINAVMLDIKDKQGRILYQTQNEQALAWEAVSSGAIDLEALVRSLDGRNLSLIVRMSAFSDPIAARGDRTNNAIHYQNTDMLWLDNTAAAGGKPWLNPYSTQAGEYLEAVALEAVELGAALVVLDDVQFPDDVSGAATFGAAAAGSSRGEALTAFVEKLTESVEERGARLAVYLPAVTLTQSESQSRYGSSNPLETLGSTIVLGILPTQFDNGFSAGGLTLERPGDNLDGTVREVLTFAGGKTASAEQSLIPLMLGGGETASSRQVQAQTDAAGELGYREYVLYQAEGAYNLK